MSDNQSKNECAETWVGTTIPPPTQFGQENTTLQDTSNEDTNMNGNTHSQILKKSTDGNPNEPNIRIKNDESSPSDKQPNETSPEVEIIGHVDTDSTNLVGDSIPTFQESTSSKSTFGSHGKRRSKSRQNVSENNRGKTVETLTHSEKEHNNGKNMKINIQEPHSLESVDIADQDDVDYGSDDNSSSISSIGDETMPDLEDVSYPEAEMSGLSEPDFDVWRLGRDAMVDHLEYMYHDLGVTHAWRIPRTTLRMFLLGVRERYQDNPYHNFKHCFSVAQMTYSMVCKLKLRHSLSVDDLGMLLTGAICHDVDHPGLNNAYHSHAHSPLAILYNYQSILEQHHFAVTCRILTNKERNIFINVQNRDDILNGTRQLILATDLALHKDIMEQYKRNIETGFDFKNRSHVLSLLKIIIKCADVSNEVRPENIAAPWVERLFSEYYEQSAREKRERLPVTPYMDPQQVDVTDSQEGFIKGMMLPMYSELAKLIPDAKMFYVFPLTEALHRYEIQKRQTM